MLRTGTDRHFKLVSITLLFNLTLAACSGGGGSGNTSTAGQAGSGNPFAVPNIYAGSDPSSVTDVNVNRLWSFGDSYSDTDREPFRNWARQLDAGGPVGSLRSFAQSSARAQGGATANSYHRQVDRFFAQSGGFADRDLTSVYLGYNDVLNTVDIAVSQANYRTQTQRLINAGATADGRRIFLATIHDISKAPSPRSATRAKVVDWNRFIAGYANSNSNIVAVDLGTVFDRIIADPSRFGFTNVTSASSASTALYADSVHFGVRGHQVIAEVYRHYLTRAWDWANTVNAGTAGAARLNTDIDNGVLLSLDQKQKLGLSAFAFGEKVDQYEADRAPNYRDALGFSGQDGGAGIRHRSGPHSSVGLAVGNYHDGFRDLRDAGGSRSLVQTDGLSMFWQQQVGKLQLDSRFTYGRNQHDRRSRDGLIGDMSRAQFEGQTSTFSQKIGLPIQQSYGWLTPWLRLNYQHQTIENYTISNPFLSNLTYKSNDVTDITATIGLNGTSDQLPLGHLGSWRLNAGLALVHPLVNDDYEVRVSEAALAGSGQKEIIKRKNSSHLQLTLGSAVDWNDLWSVQAGYMLDADLAGKSQHGLTARLHYRF